MKVGSVAVVGRPNAGKSTLVNRLVGEKVAIVSDKPQTTRKRILGVARGPGYEIALFDTPGIHKPEHRLNTAMVRDATDALATADVVLWIVDAAEERGPGEAYIRTLLERAGRPTLLALNKIDRLAKPKLLPLLRDFGAHPLFRQIVPISALTGDGVDRLREVLAGELSDGESVYPDDFLTSTPESEWVGEVIREKLLERTRDELPFASAVVIEAVREDSEKPLTVIHASIVVEREGQKGIVVGKGGSMIKQIGTAAREELEAETGRRFFLELNVRVRERWRDDERFLAGLMADPRRDPGGV